MCSSTDCIGLHVRACTNNVNWGHTALSESAPTFPKAYGTTGSASPWHQRAGIVKFADGSLPGTRSSVGPIKLLIATTPARGWQSKQTNEKVWQICNTTLKVVMIKVFIKTITINSIITGLLHINALTWTIFHAIIWKPTWYVLQKLNLMQAILQYLRIVEGSSDSQRAALREATNKDSFRGYAKRNLLVN